MGDLFRFSGITTKVRGMQRWLISDEDFKRMGQCGTVAEAVAFLRTFPPYDSILSGIPDKQLHRGVIEEHLVLTEYQDFDRLYHFADVKQKQFLKLYFQRFELSALKRCLRRVAAVSAQAADMPGSTADTQNGQAGEISGIFPGEAAENSLAMFRPYFERYSRLRLDALIRAKTLGELIAAAQGSQYGEILSALYRQDSRRLIDYESACDMRYFRQLWEKSRKQLSKENREIIERTVGAKIDTLNLAWIYRAKKYYTLTSAELYALLIPIRYRLKREEIRAMAEAESLPQYLALVKKSVYGRTSEEELENGVQMEAWIDGLMDRVYKLSYQKDPYSIACLNSYFYMKEKEIARIINTIERVRYHAENPSGGGTGL